VEDAVGDRLAPVADWLAREGRLIASPAVFVGKLMDRVLLAGMPVWRFYIGQQLIHPQLQAMGYMWRRGEPVQSIARAYGIQFTPAYIGSPLQEAREQARPVRYRLDKLGDDSHVLLRELKADGGTDYLALTMRISRPGPVPVVTFATDRKEGFSEADIADLTRLVDMMGAVTEMHIEHSVAETVANTYLGHQVGERVLKGAIRRGEGEEIRAVLWFSDMRDFTGLNERLPPSEVLELLNNYFQLVGDALTSHGGEILKFIGDGVMAYFPAEDALFLPLVTTAALNAARQVLGDIEAANEARAAGGAEPVRFGIGLHVGSVTFGNIGTEDRLDFTVIGPAVNRASRLEGLTKALEVKVCASADFHENCPEPMRSLGFHRLRGVPKPMEIFTLPD
jgi:adenylate cyclase